MDLLTLYFGSRLASDVISSRFDASDAKRNAEEARWDVRTLSAELDRTQLACAAIWSILQDKLNVGDQELLEKINEIDLADGKLDGKVQKPPVAYPKCNRTISRRIPKCIYCGQAVMHEPFT